MRMNRIVWFLVPLAMMIVVGLLSACATPSDEQLASSGMTRDEWRARQSSLRITGVHLLITDLQLRGAVDAEEAAKLRSSADMIRACLRKDPACQADLSAVEDVRRQADLARRAAAGDPLAQIEIAEAMLDALDKRLRERAAQ